MRSSHKAKEAKIFKFHNFTQDQPEALKQEDVILRNTPFLSFNNEPEQARQDQGRQTRQVSTALPYLKFWEEPDPSGEDKEKEREKELVRMGKDVVQIAEVPYLSFGDEDLKFKKGNPKLNTEKASEDSEELGGTEKSAATKSVIKEPEKPKSLEMSARETAQKIISEAEQEAQDTVIRSLEQAKTIVDDANRAIADKMAKAEEEAEKLIEKTKEEAYRAGYEEGLAGGIEDGREQALAESKERFRAFFKAIDEACEEIDARKEENLQQSLKDLTTLSLEVSEKIIATALDTCGEVAKRMILAAAADASEKQWTQITISAKDALLMEEEGINIGNELYLISDKIDLIIVDDAVSGTCLIEFPDQAIDASANTQLKNIKTALSEVE